FAETAQAPDNCAICEDERQYIGLDGQQWTTLEQLRSSHKTKIQEEEPGLISFCIEPKFGIGQRAFLVRTPSGNVLWDCISLMDDAAVERIQSMGGLAAIAMSHPHYYTCMVELSRLFGDTPIYVHRDDAKWVMRPDRRICFWNTETQQLPGGLKIVRCGGHFEGACVLNWPAGASGKGALLTGDTIQVVPDRRWVSFMYSYPNYIPLNAAQVGIIVSGIESLAFDRIYGAFPGMTAWMDGKQAVLRSAERYLRSIANSSHTALNVGYHGTHGTE
ncbi:MAG: MBL fold metallo-hydrolase, partial [Acidobacteriota bacterium]|nr:MBL fold metallo-hydrolase [Acidobacteriota bacterium]